MTEIVNLCDPARPKPYVVNLYVLHFCLGFKTMYLKLNFLLFAIQKYKD